MMGVTLFHLVFQKPISTGKNTPKNIKIDDSIDPTLRHLFDKLLDENPEKRYTMYELKVSSLFKKA
jgi:hypothetical protein